MCSTGKTIDCISKTTATYYILKAATYIWHMEIVIGDSKADIFYLMFLQWHLKYA